MPMTANIIEFGEDQTLRTIIVIIDKIVRYGYLN